MLTFLGRGSAFENIMEYHATLTSAPLVESENNQFFLLITKGQTEFSARLFEISMLGFSRNLIRYFFLLIIYPIALFS